MPNTDQKANFLFKRSVGLGDSNINVQFFSEILPSVVPVKPSSIWTDDALIPAVAPVLAPDAIDGTGTVQYKEKVLLTLQTSNDSYYSADLINAIPFTRDPNGSYNYTLYQNDGVTVVPFGLGDWNVDNASGLLTFYGTIPPGSPFRISFYKYVGQLGLNSVASITDANGISVISDGANGVNPVNKAESSTINTTYIRADNGLTVLEGPNVPGGLSDVAPYGSVDNSANETKLVYKIVTVNDATELVVAFPSYNTNRQSYNIEAKCHGTTSTGSDVVVRTIKSTFCSPSDPISSTYHSGTIVGGSVNVVKSGNFYNLNITGIDTYTITWIVCLTYSQYRLPDI